MSSVVLTGDTSGSGTITVPAVAGTFTATIGSATGTHYPFTAGTAVASTSGTSIDFTSIPSWVKRITVMFSGVSTNGTSNPLMQIGAGSVLTSGYLGSAQTISTTGIATTGWALSASTAATSIFNGSAVITNMGSNVWSMFGVIGYSNAAGVAMFGGSVSLGGILDRVRITTVNGTDTFDAGSINILYE
jgi:hypothetical protein